MYASEHSFRIVVLPLDDMLLYLFRVVAQHLVGLCLKVIIQALHKVDVVVVDLRSDLLLGQWHLQNMTLESDILVCPDQRVVVGLGHLLSHDHCA